MCRLRRSCCQDAIRSGRIVSPETLHQFRACQNLRKPRSDEKRNASDCITSFGPCISKLSSSDASTIAVRALSSTFGRPVGASEWKDNDGSLCSFEWQLNRSAFWEMMAGSSVILVVPLSISGIELGFYDEILVAF